MNLLKNVSVACKINDLIFKEIVEDFKFKSEKEVERYILRRFGDFGVGYAYKPIVANNNMIIHAKPRNKKLEKGFLVMDFGARVNGCCSDMTRTIFLGDSSEFDRKIYDLILKCQTSSLKKIKNGVQCREVDAHARRFLRSYSKYFTHALGHGVGWRVHQKPVMRPKSDEFFEKGQIVAVEPGIYFKKGTREIAIRIEDTVVVEKNGVKIISKADKSFIEVGKNVFK